MTILQRVGSVLFASLLALGCRAPDGSEPPRTGAPLIDVDGEVIGHVDLLEGPDALLIEISTTGLAPGGHGVHVHAAGICEPPFASAGSHLGLDAAAHGFLAPEGPHDGDLPNLFVAAGAATSRAHFHLRVLSSDLADADGSALVIHAGPDDYRTDPAGASGARVACAVLRPPSNPDPEG